MDKVKYAVYHCQICGKTHYLKASWKAKTEEELEKEFGVSIEEEMTDSLIRTSERSLHEFHAEAEFIPERLGFSLVKEEK